MARAIGHACMRGARMRAWAMHACRHAIRVELERDADPLDQLARLLDDHRTRVCDDASHLHRVPARTLAHDVAIERVENALMCQLQRVVQHNSLLGFCNLHTHMPAWCGHTDDYT